jgi:hypothetical protein
MKKDKDAIMRQILGLLKELVDDGGAKLPTAPAASQPAGDTGGWGKALIKAVSEKEIETKRGPTTKLALKLSWVENGQTFEQWAGTLNDEIRAQAAKFDKGDKVEVLLKRNGDFWNLMGIRDSVPRTCGLPDSEVPF